MNDAILNEIKEFAVRKLNAAYGYCGVADGDTQVMINSDDKKGNDIKIIMKLEEE